MQSPSPAQGRLYVRLSDDLATLVGRYEVYEDELLDLLRGRNHLSYPSPLLGPLLEALPEVFEEEVLKLRLDPTDLAMFAQASRGCKAAVVASGLVTAGDTAEEPYIVADFVESVEHLAWAKANGCPWGEKTCEIVAGGGNLEVLRWARKEHCKLTIRPAKSPLIGGTLRW